MESGDLGGTCNFSLLKTQGTIRNDLASLRSGQQTRENQTSQHSEGSKPSLARLLRSPLSALLSESLALVFTLRAEI